MNVLGFHGKFNHFCQYYALKNSNLINNWISLCYLLKSLNKSDLFSFSVVFIELMAGYHDLDTTLNINRDKVTLRAYQDDEVHVVSSILSSLLIFLIYPFICTVFEKSHTDTRTVYIMVIV